MSSIPNPLIKFEEICNFPFTEWTRTSRFVDYKLYKLTFLAKKKDKAIWYTIYLSVPHPFLLPFAKIREIHNSPLNKFYSDLWDCGEI